MNPVKPLWYLSLGTMGAAFLAAFGLFANVASAGGSAQVPQFKVVPDWPKALPNKWLIGQVGGISVDRKDNVWILQRPRTLTNDEAGATEIDPNVMPPTPDVDTYGNSRPQGARSDCCLPAPPVMQFDKNGNLLQAWGGETHDPRWKWLRSEGNQFVSIEFSCSVAGAYGPCEWPATEHGIYVDHNDNVYIAGNGNGGASTDFGASGRGWDGQVLKFAKDGTFLLEVGGAGNTAGNVSNDTDGGMNGTPQLWRPADMEVDAGPNTPSGRDELYIADGYGNNRVVVVDAETGLYLRHWGAYGENPVTGTESGPYIKDQAPARHFRNPTHAVRIAKDGLVYVADRVNDRIQVFNKWKVGDPCTVSTPPKSGECGFVKEFFVETDTLGNGSTWDVDVSADKKQSCLYNPDGENNRVWTLARQTGEILATFGRNGRSAGQFHWVHNLAVDSKGNIYTAEVDTGKRAQKFKQEGPEGCSSRGHGGHKH